MRTTPGRPIVIGHRGALGHAPENTLAGLRRAHELGMSWVEFDVMLSQDGVPLLIHDETLERTTDGRGRVAETSAGELECLDAGLWFGAAWRGERIPRLSQALAVLEQLGMRAIIEIKPSAGADVATAGAVVRALGPRREHVVSSFSRVALTVVQRALPDLARALLVESPPADWQDAVAALGCGALHVADDAVDAPLAEAVTGAGLELFVYTVNDAGRARALFDLGAGGVFSDFPDRIAPVAAAWRPAR